MASSAGARTQPLPQLPPPGSAGQLSRSVLASSPLPASPSPPEPRLPPVKPLARSSSRGNAIAALRRAASDRAKQGASRSTTTTTLATGSQAAPARGSPLPRTGRVLTVQATVSRFEARRMADSSEPSGAATSHSSRHASGAAGSGPASGSAFMPTSAPPSPTPPCISSESRDPGDARVSVFKPPARQASLRRRPAPVSVQAPPLPPTPTPPPVSPRPVLRISPPEPSDLPHHRQHAATSTDQPQESDEDTLQPWQTSLSPPSASSLPSAGSDLLTASSASSKSSPGLLERADSAAARLESLARLTGTAAAAPPSSKTLPAFLLGKHREEAERRGFAFGPSPPSGSSPSPSPEHDRIGPMMGLGGVGAALLLPPGEGHGLGFSVGPGGRGVPRLSALQRKALEKIANGHVIGGAALSRSHTTTGNERARARARAGIAAVAEPASTGAEAGTEEAGAGQPQGRLHLGVPEAVEAGSDAPAAGNAAGGDARSQARSNLIRKLSSRGRGNGNGNEGAGAEGFGRGRDHGESIRPTAQGTLQLPSLGRIKARPRSGSLSDLPALNQLWLRNATMARPEGGSPAAMHTASTELQGTAQDEDETEALEGAEDGESGAERDEGGEDDEDELMMGPEAAEAALLQALGGGGLLVLGATPEDGARASPAFSAPSGRWVEPELQDIDEGEEQGEGFAPVPTQSLHAAASGFELRRTSASPTRGEPDVSPYTPSSTSLAASVASPDSRPSYHAPYSPSPTATSKRTSGVSAFTVTSEFRAYRHSVERDRDSVLDRLGLSEEGAWEWQKYADQWATKSDMVVKSGGWVGPPDRSSGHAEEELAVVGALERGERGGVEQRGAASEDGPGQAHGLMVTSLVVKAHAGEPPANPSDAADGAPSPAGFLREPGPTWSPATPHTMPRRQFSAAHPSLTHGASPPGDVGRREDEESGIPITLSGPTHQQHQLFELALHNDHQHHPHGPPPSGSPASPAQTLPLARGGGGGGGRGGGGGAKGWMNGHSSLFDSMDSFPVSVSSQSVADSAASTGTARASPPPATVPAGFNTRSPVAGLEPRSDPGSPLNGRAEASQEYRFPPPQIQTQASSSPQASQLKPTPSLASRWLKKVALDSPKKDTVYMDRVNRAYEEMTRSGSSGASSPRQTETSPLSGSFTFHQHQKSLSSSTTNSLRSTAFNAARQFPPTSAAETSLPPATAADLVRYSDHKLAPFPALLPASSITPAPLTPPQPPKRSHSRGDSEVSVRSNRSGSRMGLMSSAASLVSSIRSRSRKGSEASSASPVAWQQTPCTSRSGHGEADPKERPGPPTIVVPHADAFEDAKRHIARRLAPWFSQPGSPLLRPPRSLVATWPLLQVKDSTTAKDRCLFLFNDLLVVAKPLTEDEPSSPMATRYLVKAIAELSRVKLAVLVEKRASSPSDPWRLEFAHHFDDDPVGAVGTLITSGHIPDDPGAIARVLLEVGELDREEVGEYLATPGHGRVLAAYMGLLHIEGLQVDDAVRAFVQTICWPINPAAAERLLEAFAGHWAAVNPALGLDDAQAGQLVLAILRLNDALHPDSSRGGSSALFSFPNSAITRNDFVAAFQDRDGEGTVADELLDRVYTGVRRNRIEEAPQSPDVAKPVTVTGLPSRLAYKTASDLVTVSIPKSDRAFSIKLHGPGLRFEPPLLTFAGTTTATFRVSGHRVGAAPVAFIKLGASAGQYCGLPLSRRVIIERAFMRHTAHVSLRGPAGRERQYLYAFPSSAARDEVLSALRRQRQQAAAATAAAPREGVSALALQVLCRTLLPDPAAQEAAPAPAPAPTPAPAPAPARRHQRLIRRISRSKLYPASGQGQREKDLERAASARDARERDAPELRLHRTGQELVTVCEQNSLLPVALSLLQSDAADAPVPLA